MRIVGVSVVRNEADIIRITVLHHLAAGLDRLLIIDNGSTDGTDRILRQLARDRRVDWSRDEGLFRQGEMLTTLARRATAAGADWVIPFDADEFWYAPQRPLRQVLATSTAAALRVHLVDFIQRREQLRPSAGALQHMTRRVAKPVGDMGRDWEVVATEHTAYVEAKRSPKWISRAAATITVSCGNHTVTGVPGIYDETDEIVCLHAPLRSRERLAAKAQRVPSADAPHGGGWQLGRWRALQEASRLDQEWAANSYAAGCLDVNGDRHPVIFDPTLRDLVTPWLPRPWWTRVTGGPVRHPWPQGASPRDRCSATAVPLVELKPSDGDVIPLAGPVHQVGLAVGLWPDGWVGDELRFWVVAHQPIHAITIEGYTPFAADEPVDLRVSIAGVVTIRSFGVSSFPCRIPCVMPMGTTIELAVVAGRTWCPRELSGSVDARRLSFVLTRIAFESEADATEPK